MFHNPVDTKLVNSYSIALAKAQTISVNYLSFVVKSNIPPTFNFVNNNLTKNINFLFRFNNTSKFVAWQG